MSQWSKSRTPEILFWEKVDKSAGHGPDGECWLWMAGRRGNRTTNPNNSYGVFRFKNVPQLAHRVAYMITKGKIGRGLEVLHTCDNPPCVNPAHLRAASHKDNVRDSWAKGRGKIPLRVGPRK